MLGWTSAPILRFRQNPLGSRGGQAEPVPLVDSFSL